MPLRQAEDTPPPERRQVMSASDISSYASAIYCYPAILPPLCQRHDECPYAHTTPIFFIRHRLSPAQRRYRPMPRRLYHRFSPSFDASSRPPGRKPLSPVHRLICYIVQPSTTPPPALSTCRRAPPPPPEPAHAFTMLTPSGPPSRRHRRRRCRLCQHGCPPRRRYAASHRPARTLPTYASHIFTRVASVVTIFCRERHGVSDA